MTEAIARVERLVELRRTVVNQLDQAVLEARAAGATWEQIATAMGAQRQVVWRKYHEAAEQP